jgi:uncharacterized SAM-binding protein YcdF (DUF218 family)
MPHFRIGGINPLGVQSIATSLLLPPLLCTLLALAGGVLAWRGRRLARLGGFLVALAMLVQLLLVTPFVAGHLRASLEHFPQAPALPPPGAVVVLSADAAHSRAGMEIGPLTLERLLAGAALSRETGLPLLVTGGPFFPGGPAIARLMADSLAGNFLIQAHWVEGRARNTRENALFSAEILRQAGISSAYVVTHAWHMPRSLESFSRAGFAAFPAPVRIDRVPDGRLEDWIPRADRLGDSWFYLREWAGILVYRLRDGPAALPAPRQ